MSNKPELNNHYENFIDGKWTPPVDGDYFDNTSPVDGKVLTKIPRSTKKDIDLAVAAANKAAPAWGKTTATERCNILNKIADELKRI